MSALRAIRVEDPGFVGEELSRDWLFGTAESRNSESGPRTIYLRPGVAIRGSVEASGHPVVQNALVHCVNNGGNGSVDLWASAITDANGLFTVQCPIKRVKLIVTHADYRRGITDWIDLKTAQDSFSRIVLERGTHLYGRVLDEEGEPIERTSLSVTDVENQVHGMHQWDDSKLYLEPSLYWSLTESDGSFDYGRVTGHLQLRTSARDGALGIQEVYLQDQDEVYVELQLDAGVTVSGTVMFNGAPTQNVMVDWACEGFRYTGVRPQLTDTLGRFTLKQLTQKPELYASNCSVVARPREDEEVKKGAIGGFLTTKLSAHPGDSDLIVELLSEQPGALEITLDYVDSEYRAVFRLTPLGKLANTTPAVEIRRYRASATEPIVFQRLRPGWYLVEADFSEQSNPDWVEIEIKGGRTEKLILVAP